MGPRTGQKKKNKKAALDAERAARDEEENTLRLEREKEKRRLQEEEAANALKDRIRLRNAEVDRFVSDADQMTEIKSIRNNRLLHESKVISEKQAWMDFISCNDTETNIGHLNSLITELNEEIDPAFENLCEFSIKARKIVGKVLEQILLEKLKDTITSSSSNLEESASQFQDVIQSKFDTVTRQYLERNIDLFMKDQANPQNNRTFTTQNEVCSSVDILAFHDNNEISETNISFSSITMNFPKSVASTLVGSAIRVLNLPLNGQSLVQKQGGQMILGGTYQIQFLKLPTLPRKAGEWMIKLASNGKDLEPKSTEVSTKSQNQVMECQIKIPSFLIPSDSVKVVMLEDNSSWSSDNFLESIYDESNRTISFNFRFPTSSTFAMVQSCSEEIPYQSWTIGPLLNDESVNLDENISCQSSRVQLCLETPRFHIEIHVVGSKCTLISPDLVQLQHLKGIFLSPVQLLSSLSYCGIHLLPSDSDASNTRTLKMKEIENHFCDEASLLSTAFFSKSSPYNSQLGRNQGMYQIKESDVFTGGCDPYPMNLLFMELDNESSSFLNAPGSNSLPSNYGRVRCSVIKGTDEQKRPKCVEDDYDNHNFSIQALDFSEVAGTKSSLFPFFCLAPISSEEATKRVKDASPLVTETVAQLLKLIRPFNFSI